MPTPLCPNHSQADMNSALLWKGNFLCLQPISELQTISSPCPWPMLKKWKKKKTEILLGKPWLWAAYLRLEKENEADEGFKLTRSISWPAHRNCSASFNRVANASLEYRLLRTSEERKSQFSARWERVMRPPLTCTHYMILIVKNSAEIPIQVTQIKFSSIGHIIGQQKIRKITQQNFNN